MAITVKPHMITTSHALKNLSPEKYLIKIFKIIFLNCFISRRQCFFNKERALRFYKVYSQKNCEMECIANFTFAKCGCVKFSMPRNIN